ncbi:MAG: DUF1573 domain-containing protein [Acidobacteria bacterium]|nr:DUF1573 domain-containing protein [Acidobacteriota bacterium]
MLFSPISLFPWKRASVQLLLSAILVVGLPRPEFLSAAALPPQQAASESASDPAQQLGRRVREFYSLLQARQVAKAESYATKDSRERLRDQVGSPLLGFRIISVQVSPDGVNGDVTIELTAMAAYVASPFPVEKKTQWRMEDGEWRILVPEPAQLSLESMMGMGGGEPAKPEELKFGGHRFGLGQMKNGEKKVARFPFTNPTDHLVTITQVATGCECLKVKDFKKEYKPGESGELVIEFDSTNYPGVYAQTMMVKTSPGDATSYLLVEGETPIRVDPPRASGQPGM